MRSETSVLGVKILSKLLIILMLSIGTFNANADFLDLFTDSNPEVKIDCGEQDCNIQTGIELVENTVNGIEKDRTFSEYIQDIVVYLLGFLSIVAVLYIIYAGFRILTGAGEEEVLKKQKVTILYVIIGMAVIWLAYPITAFIIQVLNATPTT